MFTEDELDWMRQILSDYEPFQIAASYYYKKKVEAEREANKNQVKHELDTLRKISRSYTPDEIIKLKSKRERDKQRVCTFAGIYIINNLNRNMFYIGKGEDLFKRVYRHFIGEGNPELYEDFSSFDDEFVINLIPLENTSFSSLNELEGSAIIAYNTIEPNGYNRQPGNTMDKPIWDNETYCEVSDFIISKIVKTDDFMNLTNNKKRMRYIRELFNMYNLPSNDSFQVNFLKAIKVYQKVLKQK